MKRLKKILFSILVRIQRRARKKGFKEAIAKAHKIANRTGKTCLIFFIQGQYEVYEKQFLTRLRYDHKAFVGKSNEEIENMSVLKIYAMANKPGEKKMTEDQIKKLKAERERLVSSGKIVRKDAERNVGNYNNNKDTKK